MCGRFFICLLALLSVILAVPAAMPAQSEPALRTPEDPAFFPPLRWLPPRAQPVPHPIGPVALSQVSRAAGMIFSGRVTAIAHVHTSSSRAIETVAVTFHVERAIRGVRGGETLTVVEWGGLWSEGQHYRVGERLLLFLYPPSRLGLTSSVGVLGRFSVDSEGRVLLSRRHSLAFAADPILGGKSRVAFSDFAQDVRRASGENERVR